MNAHLPVLPILVPLLAGMVCLGLSNRGIRAQRLASLVGILAGVAVAVLAVRSASSGVISVYRLGEWPAPYGIVLVLDRLSAMMVALSALLALAVWWQAHSEADDHTPYFHPLLQLQLAGLAGAFLTGDLFNLFVFFEILLIASYGLLVWGGGRERLRAGIAYVAINLVGSSLFLIAIGLVYGLAGSLNLADLSVRIARLATEDLALAEAGALLLAVVFALKAALAPLHLWLQRAYAHTSTPVAMLFAIMTKVGVYALLRVHGQLFGASAGPLSKVVVPWLVAAALLTIVIATAAALAARSLRPQLAALLVASVGVMVVAVGQLEPNLAGAGLYYLLQSTLVLAALFGLAEAIGIRRGSEAFEPFGWKPGAWLATTFLVAAAAAAGLPPFAGFLGKALILRHSLGMHWVWLVILTASLAGLVALARGGMALFWDRPDEVATRVDRAPSLGPTWLLLTMVLMLTVFAGPVASYTRSAAAQTLTPGLYVEAVLGATP